MSGTGGWAIPGFGAASYTVAEREIFWGRDDMHLPILYRSSVIAGTTRDAGNTPTTLLRRGLILGRIDASAKLKEWLSTATDGSQNIFAVLNCDLRAQDFDGTNIDRAFETVLRAPVIADKLLIQGAAFIGHADEYLARQQMISAGFIFDDDPQGFRGGSSPRYSFETATTDTLTADQTGMTLFYSNVAAVLVTLPAIKPGLVFDIVRTADEEIVVASAEGDNIIVGNDLSADSVTITTAGQQIGARVRVRSVYANATTLKWLIELPQPPFGTGFTGGFAYSIQT